MAYETASATGPGDLIDKLRIFAEANGWTTDYDGSFTTDGGVFGAPGAASSAVLMHKGDIYAAFFADTHAGNTDFPGPFVGASHYPGPYSGVLGPQHQTDITARNWSSKMGGPYQAYHFFAGDNYLHAVVEVTPGSYRHLGVGQLEKAGAITTAVYAHGTMWNFNTNYAGNVFDRHLIPFDDAAGSSHPAPKGTIIRADSDALAPRNVVICNDVGNGGSGIGGWRRNGAPLSGLMRMTPSSLTGRAVLYPCILGVHRPESMESLLGSVRDVRWTRIDNQAPGDVITIGADNWKLFPVIRKNGPAGQENSDGYGMAYRVIA